MSWLAPIQAKFKKRLQGGGAAKKVVIDGKEYPSQRAAKKALKIGWLKIKALTH